MMRAKLSRAMSLVLALLMVCTCLTPAALAAEGTGTAETSSRRTMQEWNEILNTSDYEKYLERHADKKVASSTVTVDATAYDADTTTDAEAEVLFDVNADGERSLYTSDSGKVTWKFTVREAGLYSIRLVCYPGNAKRGDSAEKSTDVERILYVNGKVPFSEARSITVTKKWAPQYTNGGFQEDLAGNDLRPHNLSAVDWMDYMVKDSTGYYTDPLLFYFAAGENTISLEAAREPMSLKQIILEPAAEIPTYEEYKAAHTYKQGEDAPIKLEAETPTYQSDESIYPLTDRTSAITSPQDPTVQRLNYMGGSENMKTVGGYVLVGVISFSTAVMITVLCIRLREREHRGQGTGKGNASQQWEEKNS